MKFFGPPTTKWWSFKIFVELNGKHFLMANIFKIHKYQTIGLPLSNSVCEKAWFTINGLSKILFLFLLFSFFQISNDYCQKSYGKTVLFYNRGFLWSSTTSQFFLIYIVLTALLKVFEISTEIHFVSLFFLNARNITTSLTTVQLELWSIMLI